MNMPQHLFASIQPVPVGKVPKRGPYYDQAAPLRKRRQELRLSQVAVAELYGSQQGYISDVERGWTNFAGSDLDWFRRMGAALQMDFRQLMKELEVPYVIAEQGLPEHEAHERTLTLTPASAPAGYAVIEIQITETGENGMSVHHRSVVVTQEIAALAPVRGLLVKGNYLNAASPGLVAVYADVTPAPDDVVVIQMASELHLAYFTESGFVATDRPISGRVALEFEPDRILGVVQTFTSPDKPRRIPN